MKELFLIQNYSLIGAEAKKMMDDFIDLIHEIGARGCPIEIRTDKTRRGV